jgi:glycosyltransferase involved in cell wall biosynthesis
MQILDDIPAFYYGTSPNKFFDYLSAGLPVFCNYPGWVSEMITEYECGFVSKPGNAMHFADTIMEILQQRDNLHALGNNALRLAKSKFNRSELAKDWMAWVLYERKR